MADLIGRQLKDPRLQGMVSVTAVQSTPDLATARVFVSVMGSEEEKKTSLRTLQHAAGFFRHELRERLSLRRVPELDFRLDTSIEQGDHVLGLLRELRREQPRQAGDEGETPSGPGDKE
ncbi:MAG: 30S ribosome-binding factor RbfA [Chloroflexi bacterium]|nr:30S ribosome-binding factor RbfA [Chloroflexota bacterium]